MSLGTGVIKTSLETDVIVYLKDIPKSDIIIAYICAGICELTYKEYHSGGVELSLHSQQNVVQNIAD